MSRRPKKETETYGLSFLDAISCGFGAVVLLLVLTKIATPTEIKDKGVGLESLAAELASQLPDLESRLKSLQTKLADAGTQLDDADKKLAQMRPKARASEEERAEAKKKLEAAKATENQLAIAKQKLTEEMKRLYASGVKPVSKSVGGVPIDSEYIIFVIDTSGSMHRYAWPAAIKKIQETLDIYPKVKGLQIMNDMGDYMFSNYAGQWIPDTKSRRKIIVQRMRTWQPFSNSSPVEGITRAIRAFYARDRKISIYVLGDEFSGGSVQGVLDAVARINPKDENGKPLVRIHGIGFPVQFTNGTIRPTGLQFSILMRALTQANGGTFVGLKDLK